MDELVSQAWVQCPALDLGRRAPASMSPMHWERRRLLPERVGAAHTLLPPELRSMPSGRASGDWEVEDAQCSGANSAARPSSVHSAAIPGPPHTGFLSLSAHVTPCRVLPCLLLRGEPTLASDEF